MVASNPTIWTIGHSTRPIDEFISLLKTHRIQTLGDIRTHPGSRKFPHFNQDALAASLKEAGIDYIHFPELGGRRKPRPDSPNTAWRSSAFRGFADYMETPDFQAGLQRLLDLSANHRVALMCAEAVWWRCHRGLIADTLKSRGTTVLHIEDAKAPKEHPYTSAARIEAGRLVYSAHPSLFDPESIR
jgi:uncharacterized protein (DUF488 family)